MDPVITHGSAASDLLEKIRTRSAVVSVIGLGYVGLPLAMLFAERGFHVLGFDTDAKKMAQLNSGQSYIGHISSDRVQAALAIGRLSSTSHPERLAEADAIIICVPTPLTAHREPDMSYIEGTARTLAEILRRGQLVSLESTTYPGTTSELLLPTLEATGLRCGQNHGIP